MTRERGVSGAEEAVLEVERLGAGARVVTSIIRRLAADLYRRAAGDLERMGFTGF